MKRMILSLCVLAVSILASACATTPARDQALAGDVAHERHATGIESQVGDY